MGLFDFLRRKDERAIPEPGTPEFEAAVQGSALPDPRSISMGDAGWTSTSETIDLRESGDREQVEEVLREHGIDPEKQGQTVDASKVPGLQKALLSVLMGAGIRIPNGDGFGGGISGPEQDPRAVVAQLAKQRDAGEITDAEFEAHKQRLLGD